MVTPKEEELPLGFGLGPGLQQWQLKAAAPAVAAGPAPLQSEVVFASGLDPRTTADAVMEHFRQCGEV